MSRMGVAVFATSKKTRKGQGSKYFERRNCGRTPGHATSRYFCRSSKSPFGSIHKAPIHPDRKVSHAVAKGEMDVACMPELHSENFVLSSPTCLSKSCPSGQVYQNRESTILPCEQSAITLRHLCAHGCYFSAFASDRDRVPAFHRKRMTRPSSTVVQDEPADGKLGGTKEAIGDPSEDMKMSEDQHESCRLTRRESTARLRIAPNVNFNSPPNTDTPLGLLEELFVDNPWRLLISTIMLNRTTRVQVDQVLYRFLRQYPTPEAVLWANVDEMSTTLRPLGIRHRRSAGIVRFTREFCSLIQYKVAKLRPEGRERFKTQHDYEREAARTLHRHEIQQLYYCGSYAADAYEIFILKRYLQVVSSDKALRAYVDYQRGKCL